MADKNLRLKNVQQFDIGVKTPDKPMGVNIQRGSFLPVSEDDVNYIASVSNLIQRGLLIVENIAGAEKDIAKEVVTSLGIDEKENPNFATDEEIRKCLSASQKKMADWLDSIEEPVLLDRIYTIAMGMENLNINKLKLLKNKMPNREFIGD
nr:MAG TPA: hypothetical protein [Caudoviricetes sp.]